MSLNTYNGQYITIDVSTDDTASSKSKQFTNESSRIINKHVESRHCRNYLENNRKTGKA